jgi:small subunit ribosomal protein S24e
MEVEIISRKENKILNRQEVQFLVKGASATPSRKELRQKIAALTNADEKTMIIDTLKTSYGSTELKGTARIYKNRKDLERLELSYVIARNFPEEKKTAATAAPNK